MRTNKNFSDMVRVIYSNGLILILGFLITFILPLKLDVEQFGYWQLYYFYSGYVGLFMFGFLDGINLKYAGINYNDLNKEQFRTFFRVVLIISIIIFMLSVLILIYMEDSNRKFVFISICFNIILFNLNGYFTHLNQITSRFKHYSWGIVLERLLFVLSFVPVFFLPMQNFQLYIVINLFSRILVLIYNFITSKDMIFGKGTPLKLCIHEIIDNFKVGIFLTISAVASMLFIGYTRIIVDKYFGISEFGLYSFANSILSMAIQVVTAVSAVLYPILRKLDKSRFESINNFLNQCVLMFGFIMLLMYFPISYIIQNFFVKYSPILDYLFCLFPLMVYQCKNNIVVSTFYKSYRLERIMLINNIVGLLISYVISIWFYKIYGNIFSIVFSYAIFYIIWSHCSEWLLITKYKWSRKKRFMDLYVVSCFIIVSQISNLIFGITLYILCLLVYGITIRKEMMNMIRLLQKKSFEQVQGGQ